MDQNFTGSNDELRSKNMFQKIWVMSAGVIMNFLLALIIFSGFFYISGEPIINQGTFISGVIPGFPADSIGIKKNDQIISINNFKYDKWEDMSSFIENNPGEDIQISWQSDNVIKESSFGVK